MSGDNNYKSEKKGFPGGFLAFVVAVILIVLTMQNFNNEKSAKVSFSHQVEHLVNLDLIQKDESRKVALNDNLVTFTGKFKDQLSDDAKSRYRYLELLNGNHELLADQQRLGEEITSFRKSIKESADWFLHISGLPIPKNGYVIIDPIFNTSNQDNSIVIRQLSDKSVVSLLEVQRSFSSLNSPEQVQSLGSDLLTLIKQFRSPVLGVGDESIKQQLKELESKVAALQLPDSTMSIDQQVALYKSVITTLRSIVNSLNIETDHVRLLQLRSVRSYKASVEQQAVVVEDLDKNNAQLDKARQAVATTTWFFNNKELSTRSLEKQDAELYSQWFAQAKQEWDQFSNNQSAVFKAPDQPRNTVLERTFTSEEPAPNYFGYLLTLLPVILVVMLLYFVFSRQMKGVGSGAMTFGKSPAKLLTKEKNKITFKDVAGCDEAKEELQEIVDFLKDPAKFTALGARIPKGVLCIGAPGTGKTLIAKAVAGEADRPFFTISGSDFVEMFVGVGASRIRDLFDQAKKQAPCIIFMDEIDAVGRHRGAGIGGGHDEREQTLNQLLVEMDGFDTSEGVILIAATNRPDVLDKALLRPGRFDRRIVIDLPDVKGRYEILKVHARRIKLDPSVELMNVARNTPGSSGADLFNILNEAALLAARKGRSAVIEQDVSDACDKVRYGKERRSLELDNNEKKTTAYHESGHAVVALLVKYSDSVDKVTIIPRGMSLGATHFMPKKNRVSYWRNELLDQLAILMGGRVAEELFVGDMSSGAQMDITQATRIVRSMACEWGMTDSLGTVALDERSESGQYLGMPSYQEKHYSEETAKLIDHEVKQLLGQAHAKAKALLESNKDKVQLMTDMLIEFETLDRDDVLDIMAGKWDEEKKKKKLKLIEGMQRKLPPPPPIAPAEVKDLESDTPSPQQI